MSTKFLSAMFVATLSAAHVAMADTRPLQFHVVLGEWNLVAITRDGTGNTRPVHSVLALRDKSAVVGDNIVAVWYQLDENGSWSSTAWESYDQWKAIEAVKAEASIGDQYDDRWPTTDQNNAAIIPELPKGYEKGMFTADPLFDDVVDSPSRTELVGFLVDIGYKAAKLPIEDQTFVCSADTFLTQLAKSIEAAQSLPAADGTDSVINFGKKFQEYVGEACTSQQTPATPAPAAPPVTVVPWTPGTGWSWDSCPGSTFNPATGNCDFKFGHYKACQYQFGSVLVPIVYDWPPRIEYVKVLYRNWCCITFVNTGFSEPSVPLGTCGPCPIAAPPNPTPTQIIDCVPSIW